MTNRFPRSITGVLAGAITGALLLGAAPLHATEGGSGSYLLGSRDTMSGIVPPPGTYLSADLVYYTGHIDQLSISGIVLANANTEIFLTKINLTHSFDGHILGGRPALTITVPIVDGTLTFDSVLFGASRRISDHRTGFSDPIITPGLGWDNGHSHIAAQLSIFVPVGYYDLATVDVVTRSIDALSFGKNRFAFVPTLSYTSFSPKSGFEFSISSGITLSLRNQATDYQTAPEWQVESAVMQHLKSGFAFGATGYGYYQLGEDSGTGADNLRRQLGAQSLQARVFGAGPLITYATKLNGHSLSFKLKYVEEFGAKRRFESQIFWGNIAYAF